MTSSTSRSNSEVPQDGVKAATRTARRVVLVAFMASAALLTVLVLERASLDRATLHAVNDVRTALRLTGAILLEDERLSMSAQLYANTGDPGWSKRYDEHLPLINQAITEASVLAPAAVAERFDIATRAANDRLVELERMAFLHARTGDLKAAQGLLNGDVYAEQKTILARGTEEFTFGLNHAVETRLDALNARSWWLLAALVGLGCGGFSLLWLTLERRLAAAERAFSEKQQEVTRLALHDPLTGLANRRYLHMQLEGVMARAARAETGFALLMIDLDGFKPVNDRHGHASGDAVLMEVGRRLRRFARTGDIVARLGGDEFVVALEPSAHGDVPARAAQRLIAQIAEGIELPHGPVHVSASVGVSFFPTDGATVDDLIRKADVALYRAKAEARGDVRFFQQSMDEDVRDREALELDLRTAIANDAVVPYFQPLMDLASGGLAGFEILARWPHPTRGMVPPTTFIPIAEDSGQIDALTVTVMRAALREACSWSPSLTIALNIAPQQLKSESLINRLLEVLRETGFPPERFEIEITENALIGDLDLARRIVLGLKSHGIRVALDDFGTGYSSLGHLSELPFDKLKIDRSFINTMHRRPESATIVNAIIGLGRSLNMATTAEGIESEADAELLARLGCNVGQGYLYSRPVPAQDARALISQMRTA